MDRKPILSEDWTAVVVAFFIVILALAGVKAVLPSLAWHDAQSLTEWLSAEKSGVLLWLWMGCFILVLVAFFLKGDAVRLKYLAGFSFLFFIAIFSQLITGHAWVSGIGLEIVLFSLLLGLFISNVLGTPSFVKPVIQTELYIKIGLVLLGCGIIFSDVVQAGALGLVQSVAVVLVVWQFSFWICRKFRLDDEMRTMLSSAVAICGVSAAIATAGAIKGDSKKLSYVISLVLITAVPMMLFMPLVARSLGMTDAIAGAWLGGTIDTTGAVVAAGTLLGEDALKYATVVKFSQNVLLGIAAFIISLYWTYTKNRTQEKPTLMSIWDRFPKFVLGFLLASFVFSFILSPSQVSAVKGTLKGIQTLWFALAFTCIGLETRFSDILKMDSGKPAFAFLIAQFFNILFTLLVAYFIFG